jgi:hypothetical protein
MNRTPPKAMMCSLGLVPRVAFHKKRYRVLITPYPPLLKQSLSFNALSVNCLDLVLRTLGPARWEASLAPVGEEPALHAPLVNLAHAARRERRMTGVKRQRSERRLANAWGAGILCG